MVTAEHPVLHQKSSSTGVGYSDYVLFASDAEPIAVVEAKKTSVDAEIGREQAKQYADGLQEMGYPRPCIFYTNGHDIFFWDDTRYPPRKIYGFPTRGDLERLRFQNRERQALSSSLIDKNICDRPYQIEAIRRCLETFERGHRKALLVMATGTGKTRVTMALVDVLMRSRWVERILFLSDRNELLKQARNNFKEHLSNAPWTRVSSKNMPTEKRVYLATYPAMHGLYPKISPAFFDMVIADESHRSIYNRYKEILDHFDAYQLGLTATPVEYIDRNTFELFETENQDPTFNYPLEEAVNNNPPYLVNFKVLSIQSRFQLEGIKSGQLPRQIQKKLIEEGKDLEEIDFEGTDLEKRVTNSGTNELIVREFMEQCIKDETGTRPGKSIFFALSHKHALRLEKHFDELYPEYKGRLARVIDSHDPRAGTEGGLLDQFKNPGDPLKVALSVDMLDTGIDIPEIVNLVFAKPVFSRSKFWQMIGRGTRLCPNLFGPGKDKDSFLIIDHWKNFAFFQMNPPGKEPTATLSVPERLFGLRLDKALATLTVGKPGALDEAIKAIQDDIAALPSGTVNVKEKAEEVSMVGERSYWYNFDIKQIDYLRKHILPLMRTRSAEDFEALRFDIDIVVAQTAFLNEDEKTTERSRGHILEKIDQLPLTLNQVKAQEDIIRKAKGQGFWNSLSEENLEDLRIRLRAIMKNRVKPGRDMERLNLEDIILVKEWVDFGPEMERTTVAEYRRKVEEKIKNLLASNEVLQKLKRGDPLDDFDVFSLSEALRSEDPYITEELLQRVYDNRSAQFIEFIRHILGLQKLRSRSKVIAQAFDEFIARHNDYTADQIQFILILKTFVIEQGKVEKENLVGLPFTNVHPQGVRGLFSPSEVEEILEFSGQMG